MTCKPPDPKREPKPGDFLCKKCGAISGKKKRLCKPKKVKPK